MKNSRRKRKSHVRSMSRRQFRARQRRLRRAARGERNRRPWADRVGRVLYGREALQQLMAGGIVKGFKSSVFLDQDGEPIGPLIKIEPAPQH